MGKRSDFERVERDYYRTFDPKAGKAIKPFLPPNGDYTYAEPFCGRGDLINQLEGKCNFASDIEPDVENNVTEIHFQTKTFLDVTEDDLKHCSMVITNPPWDRKLLHQTIEHFANMKPTWLLFDNDWSNTKQAAPYLEKYCKKIVAVGRMKWVEGSGQSGKDNVSWYLFIPDKELGEKTEFYGIRL